MFSTRCIMVIVLSICAIITMGQSVSNDYDIQANGRIAKVEVLGYTDSFNPRVIAKSYKTGNIYFLNFLLEYIFVLKKGKTAARQITTKSYCYSLAVDSFAGRVHIGCSGGLKMYNEVTGRIYDNTAIGDHIYGLFVSNSRTVYALTFKNVYSRNYNVKPSKWEKLNIPFFGNEEQTLVVDFEGNFYFQSSNLFHNKTLQALLTGHTKPIKYSSTSPFTTLVAGHNGKAYGVAWDGIYRLSPDSKVPQLAFNLLNYSPYAVAFDIDDSVIFVTKDGKIVTLKYDVECSSEPQYNASHITQITETLKNLTVKFEELLLKNKELGSKIISLENNMNKNCEKSAMSNHALN